MKKRAKKIGYKAVFQDCNGTYVSASAYRYQPVNYDIGVTSKRPKGCGPLAVFKNKKDAEDFAWKNFCKVFQCKYVPSRNKTLWTHREKFSQRKYPKGTAFANEVTLTKYISSPGDTELALAA